MSARRRLLSDEAGASAAEFALVLPAALLFLFGIIDVGRFAWTLNKVEKATQIGARHAVVTDLVASGFNTADFADACGETPLIVGDRIACADAFPPVTCDDTACGCAAGGCGAVDASEYDGDAFQAILARMQTITPSIAADNLTVTYSPSGLGYYGDPLCFGVQSSDGCSTGDLSDVAPLVTVRVDEVPFQPLTFGLFDGAVSIPARAYSLSMEDGHGAKAY
ncbi:MAG TPA: TadE family protein [Reyranella sp.]|nr:TadE family protein [Reyranella sp.]